MKIAQSKLLLPICIAQSLVLDSESYYFFSDLTKVVLEDPRIRMFVKQEEEDLFSISLLSTKVAPFVTLETEM